MFVGKRVLITGGTGSFGAAVVNCLLKTDIEEIRVFSRDEKKQDSMRKNILDPRVKFIIGDVRDPISVEAACKGVHFIFHAAALKQVPSCEFFPMEATKTNVMGASNVLRSAFQNNVEKVVCLSTDKAVHPVNAMGLSKAMMEKVALAAARDSFKTKVCITRYGNVIASRGSVIPLFIQQINHGKDLTITDPKMTRFMMTLPQAVDLVLFALKHGENGDTYIQKSPAVTIETLASALKEIYNVPNHKTKIIGTRHGEKLFEVLLSREEMSVAKELDDYYRVGMDKRDLNYQNYFSEGRVFEASLKEYNSDNTTQLSLSETIDLLKSVDLVDNNFEENSIS